jgi:hypothetical protein
MLRINGDVLACVNAYKTDSTPASCIFCIIDEVLSAESNIYNIYTLPIYS